MVFMYFCVLRNSYGFVVLLLGIWYRCKHAKIDGFPIFWVYLGGFVLPFGLRKFFTVSWAPKRPTSPKPSLSLFSLFFCFGRRRVK